MATQSKFLTEIKSSLDKYRGILYFTYIALTILVTIDLFSKYKKEKA